MAVTEATLPRPTTKRFRPCDAELLDALARIANSERSVSAVERSGVLPPDSVYCNEVTPPGAARRVWAQSAFRAVADCAIVFVDPDNGLAPRSVGPLSRRAPKYVLLDEVQRGLGTHQSLVAYHHLDRTGPAAEQAQRHLTALRGAFPDHAEPWAVRFRRGTGRLYLVVPAVQHEDVLRDRRDALLAGAWGTDRHFSDGWRRGVPAATSPSALLPERQHLP